MASNLFNRRSLSTQLTLSFVVLLVPLLVVGGAGAVAFRRTAGSYRDVVATISDQIRVSTDLREAILDAEHQAVSYVSGADLTAPARYRQASAATDEGFERLLEVVPSGERALVDSAADSWAAAQRTGDAAVLEGLPFTDARGLPYTNAPEAPYPLAAFHPVIIGATSALDATTALSLRRLNREIADAERRQHGQETLLLRVLGLSVVGSALLALRFRSSIRKPLLTLRDGARRLGEDDLGHRISDTSHPEFAEVARAFNSMAEKLTDSRAALAHQAFHDPLTGLANRRLLIEHTRAALALARRSGRMVAILFLDLDDFKAVNDTLGHAAGDELLVEVARRLKSELRGSDLAARLGGDEFAILLPEFRDNESAATVAQRIIAAVSQPVTLPTHRIRIHTSIGIASNFIVDRFIEDVDMLISHADAAMYRAKERGKGGWVLFDPSMAKELDGRLELVSTSRSSP